MRDRSINVNGCLRQEGGSPGPELDDDALHSVPGSPGQTLTQALGALELDLIEVGVVEVGEQIVVAGHQAVDQAELKGAAAIPVVAIGDPINLEIDTLARYVARLNEMQGN